MNIWAIALSGQSLSVVSGVYFLFTFIPSVVSVIIELKIFRKQIKTYCIQINR